VARDAPFPSSPAALGKQQAPSTRLSPVDFRAPQRRVAMIGFADVQVLDVTGHSKYSPTARWLIDNVTGTMPRIPWRSSPPPRARCPRLLVPLVADRAFGQVRAGIDTLLVAGGRGAAAAAEHTALLSFVRGSPRAFAAFAPCAPAPSCWRRRDFSTDGAPHALGVVRRVRTGLSTSIWIGIPSSSKTAMCTHQPG